MTGIPEVVLKATLDATIILLFLINRKNLSRANKYALCVLIYYIGLAVISAIYHHNSFYSLIYFLRMIIVLFLFHIAACNCKLGKRQQERIYWIIFALAILQIPASLYKYAILGISEKFAGTIGLDGTYSTLFPAAAIVVLYAFWFRHKRVRFLFLAAGYAFMSFVAGKRGFWFYVAIIILLETIFLTRYEERTRMRRYRIYVAAMVLSIFPVLLGITIIPSLNPEHKVGGSISFPHVIRFISEYYGGSLRYENIQRSGMAYGRYGNLEQSWKEVIARIDTALLGYGIEAVRGKSYSGGELIKFNIIDGGITGANYDLLSIGVTGPIAIVFLFVFMMRNIIPLRRDPVKRRAAIVPIMLYVLILLDYISYSPTTTRMYMPTVIILFFGGKVIAKKCGFDNVRQLKSVNTIRMSDLDRNSQVRISNER